jgi:hypothetical protein
MMRSMNKDDFKLIHNYYQDRLNKSEIDILNQRLLEQEFSEAFTNYALDSEILNEVLTAEKESLQVFSKRRKIIKISTWLALAACLIVGVNLYFMFRPIAQISNITGHVVLIRNGQEHPITLDFGLRNGDTLRTSVGQCKISYDDGSVILLQENSNTLFYSENGGKRIHIQNGFLSAQVSKQEESMIIKTPTSKSKILGTAFKLKATQIETYLEVTEGAVKLTNPNGNNDIVKAGEFAIAKKGAPVISLNKEAQRTTSKQKNAFTRWQQYSNTIREDKDLVAYYDFQFKANENSNILFNRAKTTQSLPLNGEINSCLRLNGRWPEKQALYFSEYGFVNCGNNEAFNIRDQVTVFTWIKIKKFQRDFQTLVSKGDSSWRLARYSNTNSIEFACSGLIPNFYARGNIDINNDQWHMVAGVYNGKSLRLYIDGVLDLENEAQGLIHDTVHRVEIGSNSERRTRNFEGWIDEIAIFKRALSHEEIQKIYINGKP